MKLKYAIILTIATAIFTTPKANANILFDIYAGANIGAGGQTIFTEDEDISKSAESYGAVLGIDIPILRFELEYNYLDSEKAQFNMGMFNLYAKMPTTIIQPYIGVGAGTTFSSKIFEEDLNESVAYQGMLGVTFGLPVIPIKLDAEARALYIPNVYEANETKSDLLNYDLRLKLRYIF